MANVLGELFQNIANAIRSKTGGTDAITPASFPEKISAIGTSGSVEGVRYVTFMSQDGTTELYKRPVADGDDCADPVTRGYISAPTKESTAQYDYSFVGWATTPNGAWDENALKAVAEDKTVYAAYAAALRYYTITYYDEDGTTVLKTERLAYGATPNYTPQKVNYIFKGWTPSISVVQGTASYTASWQYSDVVAEGTFASGATWDLRTSGVFTVSGTGAMDDYTYSSNAPWYANRSKITSVVIMDGITNIGNTTFYLCDKIASVTIPDSVTHIGTGSFRSCASLVTVNIPSSVEIIDEYAFEGCTALVNLTIPEGVTKLKIYCFQRCSALATVVIPSTVSNIGKFAFYNAGVTSLTFKSPGGWYFGDSEGATTTSITLSGDQSARFKNYSGASKYYTRKVS